VKIPAVNGKGPVAGKLTGKRRGRSNSTSTLLRSSKRQQLAPGSPTHTPNPFKVFDEGKLRILIFVGSRSPTIAATTRHTHGIEDMEAIRLGVKMLENPR
jgi:hypothetical protein